MEAQSKDCRSINFQVAARPRKRGVGGLTRRSRIERDHWVYRLRDPITGAVRYIGISSNIALRSGMHQRGETHYLVSRWVKALKAHDAKPIFEVISPAIPFDTAAVWEARLVFLHSLMHPGRLLQASKQLRRVSVQRQGCDMEAFGFYFRSAPSLIG